MTNVGSECDDRPEDYSQRMGGRPVVGMFFFMTRLCSSSLPCLREKRLNVCQPIDRTKGGCSLRQFLS